MSQKVGRNAPCPCGKTNSNGKAIKYKKCCLNDVKSGKKVIRKITRKDFISGPYIKCPKCKKPRSFGVSTPISGSNLYSRECIECYHKKDFKLPKLHKKVIYLDQFVISNLIKLLDVSHPSHKKIIEDPFWKKLFIALEKASKSQAIICPDSFYHRNESSTGQIDFHIMKRLYEHFSGGKTLYPSSVVERFQIQHHFSNWLDGKKSTFTFNPQDIAFGQDLNVWEIGMRVSVDCNPLPEELSNLKQVRVSTKQQLADIWKRWQVEAVDFEEKVKEEALGLSKGTIQVMTDFIQRRGVAMQRMTTDPTYEPDRNDIITPPSGELIDTLLKIIRVKDIADQNSQEIICKYLLDTDALLEVPYIKISSVMWAGLARSASLGEKKPPKSTTDVQFIASYLPYSDAMFIDKQSARLIKELPKSTPKNLNLKEFNTKIFSLNEKEELLTYLEKIVNELPEEQINILKDVNGDDYDEPYWLIIEHEKARGRDAD